MRIVLQRVSGARVQVGGETVGEIGRGVLALVAVERGDDEETVRRAAERLPKLRIHADADGRMNLDTDAVEGGFLLVSQFTLAASLDRGRRPSFERAAEPARAEALFGALVETLRDGPRQVETGRFGAAMAVQLVNDGPVTFVLEF